MAFLLYVEYDTNSEQVATNMLANLSRMADIVHRDYPTVYTYVFRQDIESKTKLIFTELYADEQAFLQHSSDPEFSTLYQRTFTRTAGRSRKELCIRTDLNTSLSPIVTNILSNYLHVTYIPIEHGFLYRNINNSTEENILMTCIGCDNNVYEYFNTLFNCRTCLTFKESDDNQQLIAIIENIFNETILNNNDTKPSIKAVELVCSQDNLIEKFQKIMNNCFLIQSLQIQPNFSGYIHHKSST